MGPKSHPATANFMCFLDHVRPLISFERVGIDKQVGDLSDPVPATKEERTASPSREKSPPSTWLFHLFKS